MESPASPTTSAALRLRLRGVYPERAKRVERAPLRMTALFMRWLVVTRHLSLAS